MQPGNSDSEEHSQERQAPEKKAKSVNWKVAKQEADWKKKQKQLKEQLALEEQEEELGDTPYHFKG
jgi:hypothetical protein